MGLFDVFSNKNNDLCKATRNGALLLVKKLLEEGVDVNKKGDDGRDDYKKQETPLHYAINNNNLEVINLLLDYGADLEEDSPLYKASARGNTEVVKLLLKRGAHVDGVYDTYDGSGKNASRFMKTPLHIAASSGYVDIVKLLLEHKADVSGLKNNILDTPLAEALLYSDKYESISQLLLKYNAPVNLHLSAGLGDLSTMQKFIDEGISPKSIEYTSFGHGYTPLYFAVKCNQLNAVKILLNCGVNPREQVEYGENIKSGQDNGILALLILEHENAEMLKLLIEKGADIHKKSPYGQTLIELAKIQEKDKLVDILKNS